MLSPVELPRPIEDYFAHAELDGSGSARRFSITLPYFDGERLDRLQWWWQLGHAQARIGGDEALPTARREAAGRFRVHIETWLGQHGLVLAGDDPIPRLRRPAAAVAADDGERAADPQLSRIA